jgi:hypothetical protein
MASVADVTTGLKGSSSEQAGHCCTQSGFRVRVQGQGVGFGVILWAVLVMATYACRCGT